VQCAFVTAVDVETILISLLTIIEECVCMFVIVGWLWNSSVCDRKGIFVSILLSCTQKLNV